MKKRNARSRYKRNYVRIERRFVVAKPSEGGFSWTLSAVLGEIILKAEEVFGQRDHSYTLLGIDFSPGPNAQTWTPGNCKHIIVQLSTNGLTDRYEAYRQLAHEGIHLLSPTGKANANVLEEGLAEYFSQWYLDYVFGLGWWQNYPWHPAYAQALDGAKQLLAFDKDIIKKLRQVEPTIAYITAEQIQAVCPDASPELAAMLTRRFTRDV